MTNRRYRILNGLQYPPDEDRRREPGEIVDDIPSWLGDALEASGDIERVRDNRDHDVEPVDGPSALTEDPDGELVVAHVDEDTGKPEVGEPEPEAPVQQVEGADLVLAPEGEPVEDEPDDDTPDTLPQVDEVGADLVLEPEGKKGKR